MAYFGKTRFKVAIDVGFGDVVHPVTYRIPLITSSKRGLFEKDINLSCYPKEFIFAEKLETILYRGSFNSRMKDFHDLYSMITSSSLSPFYNLETIIRLVFEHRETKFSLPISFKEDETFRMQNFWSEYLRGLRPEYISSIPKTIVDVIAKINRWLQSNTRLIN